MKAGWSGWSGNNSRVRADINLVKLVTQGQVNLIKFNVGRFVVDVSCSKGDQRFVCVYMSIHTANIYHPAIVKLQPKADKVKEKIYNLMIKGI